MYGLKKTFILAALLVSMQSLAAPEDGTFTIEIRGPDEAPAAPAANQRNRRRPAPARTDAVDATRSTTTNTVVATPAPAQPVQVAPQTAPTPSALPVQNPPQPQASTPAQTDAVQAAPAQQVERTVPAAVQTPQTAAATGQTQTPATGNANSGGRRYEVQPTDTIWSIANRYLPADKSANEFQIVASIYRNNPSAFDGGDVNKLLRGSILMIPSNQVMRQEATDTGSNLLRRGVMRLPPLQTPVPETSARAEDNQSNPDYKAVETQLRELNERKVEETSPLKAAEAPSQEPQKPANKPTLAVNPELEKQSKAMMAANPKFDPIDVHAMHTMLDETKRAIDLKTRDIDKKLVDAIDLMKKSTLTTAQSASEDVAKLAQQYDSIISGIQQSVSDLRGTVSKLMQENDRMREMLLANDEKIEDLQMQLANFNPETEENFQQPIMLILLGVGFLTMMLLGLFIFFKIKNRKRHQNLSDDFSFDESLDANDKLLSDSLDSNDLLSGNVSIADDDKAAEKEPAEADNSSVKEPDDPGSIENIRTEATPPASETAAKAEEMSDEERKAQEEWDKAAAAAEAPAEGAGGADGDKAALDEWNKALNEQQATEEKQVEVAAAESSEEASADAWAEALNEQAAAEKGETKSKEEASADAWAEALNEQAAAEKGETKSAEDASADAWAEALNEQAAAEKGETKSTEEASADAWAEALNEQAAAEKAPKADPPPSAAEKAAADEWAAALAQQSAQESASAPAEEEALKQAMQKGGSSPKNSAPAVTAKVGEAGALDDSDPDLSGKSVDDVLNSLEMEAGSTQAAPVEEPDPEALMAEAPAAETTEAVAEETASAPADETDLEALMAEAPAAETTEAVAEETASAPADETDLEALMAEAPAETADAVPEEVVSAPADETDLEALMAEAPAAEAAEAAEAVPEDTVSAPADETDLEALMAEAPVTETAEAVAEEAVSAPADETDLEALMAEAPAETADAVPEEVVSAPADETDLEALMAEAPVTETAETVPEETASAPADETDLEALMAEAPVAETAETVPEETASAPADETDLEALMAEAPAAETAEAVPEETVNAPADETDLEALMAEAPAETAEAVTDETASIPAEEADLAAMMAEAPVAETAEAVAEEAVSAAAEETDLAAMMAETPEPEETETVAEETLSAASAVTAHNAAGQTPEGESDALEREEDARAKSLSIDVEQLEEAVRKGENVDEMLSDDLDLESLLFRKQEEPESGPAEEPVSESVAEDSASDLIEAGSDAEIPAKTDGTEADALLTEQTEPDAVEAQAEAGEAEIKEADPLLAEQAEPDATDAVEAQAEAGEAEIKEADALLAEQTEPDAADTVEAQAGAEISEADASAGTELIGSEVVAEPEAEEKVAAQDQSPESGQEIATDQQQERTATALNSVFGAQASGQSFDLPANDADIGIEPSADKAEGGQVTEEIQNENSTSALQTDSAISSAGNSEQPAELTAADNQDSGFDTTTISWQVPAGDDEFDVTGGRGDLQNPYGTRFNYNQRDELDDEFMYPDPDEPDAMQQQILSNQRIVKTDPQAENAIINMLHHGSPDNTLVEDDGANGLSDEEISSMLVTSPGQDRAASEDFNLAEESVPVDLTQGITAQDGQPNRLSRRRRGKKSLSPKQHQYFIDELNLARLYFETGDTDEAFKMVREITDEGSDDLVVKAQELLTEYGY